MDFEFMLFVIFFQLVLPFTSSSVLPHSQLDNFTVAVSNFSSELYQQCGESTSGNVVISPYSAINALVLLSQAANRTTIRQLNGSINFNGSQSDLLDGYVAYQQSLSESARNSTMVLANRLYVQQGYQMNPDFQEIATQKLLSDVQMVNFTNATAVAKIVNDFVAEKTYNRTGAIIKPESLKAATKVVLMNTIYMKLTFDQVYQPFVIDHHWYNFFSTDHSYNDTFYEGIEYVNFDSGLFNYAELHEFRAQAIEIKFADSDLSLLVILPYLEFAQNLTKLETNLENCNLTTIVDRLKYDKVFVRIPTFQIKSQLSLKNVAKKFQISNLFEKGKANLSGLLINDTSAFVADAFVTTVLEVEPGNKLDQNTDNFLHSLNGLYSSGKEQSFIANRPFMYHIWDRKLKTAILSGRLSEFEGKKRKQVHYKDSNEIECFDIHGEKSKCRLKLGF